MYTHAHTHTHIYIHIYIYMLTQSAGVVEYIDCFSTVR